MDHHAKQLLLALRDSSNLSEAQLLELLEQLVSAPLAPAVLGAAASADLLGHEAAGGLAQDVAAPDAIFLHRTPEVGSAQARGEQISAHWPRGVLLGKVLLSLPPGPLGQHGRRRRVRCLQSGPRALPRVPRESR